MNPSKAKLFVVATPIGNLEDLSARALRILQEVDFIGCETPRHTKRLLDSYNIETKIIPYKQIINRLEEGRRAALVCNAGTPCVSDPGCRLIDQVRKKGIKVRVVPGPCALAAAASVSGLPVSRFLFLGFLPKKKNRQKYLKEIVQSKRTVIFYESKYRLVKTLKELKKTPPFSSPSQGEDTGGVRRQIVVCQELTKIHETVYRGAIDQVLDQLKEATIKGEFVVLVEGVK